MSATPDFESLDFFTDRDQLINDPYSYFNYLRDKAPVLREKYHNVVMVTGYEEALEVYKDSERYSSCIATTGPFPGFPVPTEGRDDIRELIAEHWETLPFNDQLPVFDPPRHTANRALLMRMITPNRLKENEEFMWKLADRQLGELLGKARDRGEFINDYGGPYAMLVIADLLGVPETDRWEFRKALNSEVMSVGSPSGEGMGTSPLEFLYEKFSGYIEDRRRNPRGDVLTGMAQAKFPDGSTPEVIDVVRVAANLFAAGQETTVRLIAAALKVLGERPDVQERLRGERDLIPNFIEEMLRLEGPVKGDYRLSTVKTTLGGVEIPSGTIIGLMNGAANRDPRKFENPNELQLDRKNARQHLAFGYGVHACPGAPLARAETQVTLNRVLDCLGNIRIDEAEHGPPDARRYEYAPTYILRGLQALHLTFDLVKQPGT